MRSLRFLILAAALMLTGCWMGDGLYSSDDARQPIPAGIYRATAPDEKPHLERVTLLPNGMTTIGDEDGKNLYGFAPLDDANVERFCELLHRMTQETDTRYLIVTHNAVTMSRMDRLYGVTMIEKGVSRLVSVDLGGAETLLAAE